MNSEITLSADELFYLGKLMHAKYIDYAYIVCRDDSADDFQMREKTVKQSLIKKEFIFESFTGKVEAEESVTEILLSVFEGTKETSLNICTVGDKARADILKFHFWQDKITMVKANNGLLILKGISADELDKIVSNIFFDASEFAGEEKIVREGIQDVSALVSIKSVVLEKQSVIYVVAKLNGIWCLDKGDNVFESIRREELIELIVKLFKE